MRSTMPPSNPGGLAPRHYPASSPTCCKPTAAPASERPITAATTARIGKDLPGAGGRPAAPLPKPGGPTGVMVAGTVPRFVPVTDDDAARPGPRRLADAAARLQRHELQPARARSRPTTRKRLQLAWIWPMRDGGTNQPAPLVYNGTIYLANTGGIVQALDARTGQPDLGAPRRRRRRAARHLRSTATC